MTIRPAQRFDPTLKPHLVNGGRVEETEAGWRMILPPCAPDAYSDAQLDDYDHGQPRAFVNHPPRALRVRARFSHDRGALKGTAGFGFWNHPFSREGDVIAPPRNLWFFFGSQESDLRVVPGVAGHGFKAALLNTPPLPVSAGGRAGPLTRMVNRAANLALRARPLARLAMAAGRRLVHARERLLDEAVPDLRDWHEYEIDWTASRAVLRVDGRVVLDAPRPPPGPLGFVAWIDNYRATAADGQYAWGTVETHETQWLEVA